MLPYVLRRQKYIPLACCVVHNFIMMDMQGDPLFTQFDGENASLKDPQSNRNNFSRKHMSS